MPAQSNQLGIGSAIVGAEASTADFKYTPDPRPDRVYDKAAVDKSFEALKTFDWSSNYEDIQAIDDAVVMTRGNPSARKDLEIRLAASLSSGASRAAKDFSCRMLSEIGSPDSVPALAELLTDKDHSHLARYALERIPGPESLKAMRDALPKADDALKAGLIESLGARRDMASVKALTVIAGGQNIALAYAAINALGKIGTPETAEFLAGIVKTPPDELRPIAADACLVSAEKLTASGDKQQAILLYKGLSGEDQPKLVRLAATRGLLAAAKKQ
jgi:HEAT repeat protein